MNIDKLGMSASGLCIVHCVGTVVLAFVLPAGLLGIFASEWVHQILAVGVLGVGIFAFVPGYRIHKSTLILALGIIGMSFILAPHLIERFEVFEIGFTLFGGSMLMIAHWKNRCKVCRKKPFSCVKRACA